MATTKKKNAKKKTRTIDPTKTTRKALLAEAARLMKEADAQREHAIELRQLAERREAMTN